MLEGSERLLDDVKDVLNLNRVYAAGLPPEAISPAKLFLKLAAACHCHALFQGRGSWPPSALTAGGGGNAASVRRGSTGSHWRMCV